jgi:anthranilate phosphoribosyltransferase
MGTKRAFVVHGHDGLDEISICAPTRISALADGIIKTYDLSPEQFFNHTANMNDLAGGSPADNAEITSRILNGEKGPKRNIVLLNAGAALVVAGKAANVKEGIQMAEETIDSGAAADKLQQLIRFTNEMG